MINRIIATSLKDNIFFRRESVLEPKNKEMQMSLEVPAIQAPQPLLAFGLLAPLQVKYTFYCFTKCNACNMK